MRVDPKSERFTCEIDERVPERVEAMDGKLLLVIDVPDLDAAEVVARDKSLAGIERGFRVLQSETEISPVFHRLSERIRAQASLRFHHRTSNVPACWSASGSTSPELTPG